MLFRSYTLTSQTAAQKLFNTSTNGAITLPTGFFEFECFFTLSAMSSTSGSFGFALAGSATYTQIWTSVAGKTTAGANSIFGSYNTSANPALTSSSVATTGYAIIKGTLRVTVGGTVIPQGSLNVAAAAVVGAGSYFKVTQIANTSTQTIGNWS